MYIFTDGDRPGAELHKYKRNYKCKNYICVDGEWVCYAEFMEQEILSNYEVKIYHIAFDTIKTSMNLR